MICVDIPMPRKCYDCPMSYWILTGSNEGRLMCEAIACRDGVVLIVDEKAKKRPEDCPIIK